MSKALRLFQLSLCTIGYLFATVNTAIAQVTSDGTVNTQVNQNGNVAEITGGETRGSNLFHSFQDFSVNTGNEAFFNNADSISNIFSRVTGGNISNIDGAIRANGSASLFLINPAGILFGENARLDIGGSFYGSTADSISFEDGEFSAVDNLQQPILTVNAPIGLNFRDNPGDIVNRAADGLGLQVSLSKNIGLFGGKIIFEEGKIFAPEGNLFLVGISKATQIIGIDFENLSSSNTIVFENIASENISFAQNSVISANNVFVRADSFFLESSTISAKAAKLNNSFSGGGSILLEINEDLTMKNNSLIMASAFNSVNGGFIGIEARFIVGFPNQNNDIVASADLGFGGIVDVAADRIFGFQFRSSQPPNQTNDLDVSGEFATDAIK